MLYLKSEKSPVGKFEKTFQKGEVQMEFMFFIAGMFFGSIVYAIIQGISVAHGTLRIDHSDPEKDIYRLEIGDLDKLNKKSYVELKIDHHADLSQN